MTDLGARIRSVMQSAYTSLPDGVVGFGVQVVPSEADESMALIQATHDTGITEVVTVIDKWTDEQIANALVDLFSELSTTAAQNQAAIGVVGWIANPPARAWTSDD